MVAKIYKWEIHAKLAYMDSFRNLPLNFWPFCQWLPPGLEMVQHPNLGVFLLRHVYDCFPCAKMIKCEDVFPIGVETCGKRSLFLGGQDSSKTTQVLGGWNMANLLVVVCWNWYFWRDKVILDDFGPSTSSRAWHIWTNSGDVWWRSVFRLANGKHAHRGIIYRVNLCNFRSIEVQGDLYILFCLDLRESWGMILQRLGESFHGWQVQNDLASFATKGVLSYNHVTHASSVLLNGLFGSLIAPEYKGI